MTRPKRSALDDARQVAHRYRNALRAVDPAKAAELDEAERERGQWWISPAALPEAAAVAAMKAELSPAMIEQAWGIPAATIRGWISKGLLENRGKKGKPLVLVSDVLKVESRHRMS